MRIPTICAAALCLPALLGAQSGDAQQSSAQAVYDKLDAELQKQNRDYRAARKKLMASEAYQAARKERDRKKMSELLASATRPDFAALGQQAMAAAEAHQG